MALILVVVRLMLFINISNYLIVVFFINSKVRFITKIYKRLLRKVLRLVLSYKLYTSILRGRLNLLSLVSFIVIVASLL